MDSLLALFIPLVALMALVWLFDAIVEFIVLFIQGFFKP